MFKAAQSTIILTMLLFRSLINMNSDSAPGREYVSKPALLFFPDNKSSTQQLQADPTVTWRCIHSLCVCLLHASSTLPRLLILLSASWECLLKQEMEIYTRGSKMTALLWIILSQFRERQWDNLPIALMQSQTPRLFTLLCFNLCRALLVNCGAQDIHKKKNEGWEQQRVVQCHLAVSTGSWGWRWLHRCFNINISCTHLDGTWRCVLLSVMRWLCNAEVVSELLMCFHLPCPNLTLWHPALLCKGRGLHHHITPLTRSDSWDNLMLPVRHIMTLCCLLMLWRVVLLCWLGLNECRVI